MEYSAKILAAILYQEGGRYELYQGSLDAVGDEPKISFTDPITLGNLTITIVTLEDGKEQGR